MSDQLRELIAKTLWHDGLMHVMSPEDLADSLLALGTFAEEWGVTWPGSPNEIDWRGTRKRAEDVIEARRIHSPRWAEGSQLVKRYVLTTKPLPVEENQPDGN